MKTKVVFDSYPHDYTEEYMPQIIVKIRYKRDKDPRSNYKKNAVTKWSRQIKTFLDETIFWG